MEPLHNNNGHISVRLLKSGLILLSIGLLFGIVGSFQYVVPGLFKTNLSFEKVRPLHVSSVVFWIIITAMGTVLTYLRQHTRESLKASRLLNWMYGLLLVTITTILFSYGFGIFGGREYWEFHPVLAFPLALCWILFLIVFVKSMGPLKKRPVYIWMWLTGIVFFLFTFTESYLWLIPYFRSHIVNDMTIQWKSYGSMVGSWNMLVYGSGIFLLDKISGNEKYSYSKISFALYFLGLFNLLFNWGHHIYTLPTHEYVKYIGYGVSMTELIIFGRILYVWRSSLDAARKHRHITSYRFLVAADLWIFLTLALAIAMSVPAINVFTHGTHITVAHTMGATIGINSMLLMAMIVDISGSDSSSIKKKSIVIYSGFWISNLSLLVFWISLIVAGVWKAKWLMSHTRIPFGEMMQNLSPVFTLFLVSGISLSVGLMMIVLPMYKLLVQKHDASYQKLYMN